MRVPSHVNRWSLAHCLLALSCCRAGGDAPPPEQSAALGGEVAARVGDQTIPLSVVATVADAQKISTREAVRRLADDEVAATAARRHDLERRQPTAWRLVAARARFTSDRILDEAKRGGPPTDDEVKSLSLRHWQEVDRPPTIGVIHVVVLHPKKAELVSQARALATAIHEAVKTTTNAADFEKAANGVAHDAALQTKVESLPPFADDGFVAQGGGRLDEAFTKGAYTLTSPGDTTQVVESTFGWHVIRLLERFPEQRMPFETRRAAFKEEALAMRGHNLIEARLQTLRQANVVTISPAAEQLMRSAVLATTPESKAQ